MAYKSILHIITLLAVLSVVSAHSWLEQLRRIDSTGAFVGDPGYPAGWPGRATLVDYKVQNRILDKKPNPPVCLKSKADSYTTTTFPRLTAAPGDHVALIYQENGHVTQPKLTPRPYRSGLVSVYGTLHHEDSDGINDVLNSWTADGKGGNGKGQLIGTHFYDDGQCYQNLNGNFTIEVYAERFHEHGLDELYCQTDIQLPKDLPTSGTYTIMWVWDWPLIVSDTQNTTEIYTSCAEIQLQPPQASSAAQVKFSQDNPLPLNDSGIASQVAIQFEATGLGIGTTPPGAPSSTVGQGQGQASTAASSEAVATPSSSSLAKPVQSGIKTVTVTADAQTTTQWKTVTVGGSGRAERTETIPTAASTSSRPTSASSAANIAPTVNVPVISVSKFLKARATGRATGRFRRGSNDQS